MRWIRATSEHIGCLVRFREYADQEGEDSWEYGLLVAMQAQDGPRQYYVGQLSQAKPDELRSFERCEVQERAVSADLLQERGLREWGLLADEAQAHAKAAWAPMLDQAPALGCDLRTACCLIEAGAHTLARLQHQLETLGWRAEPLQEEQALGPMWLQPGETVKVDDSVAELFSGLNEKMEAAQE